MTDGGQPTRGSYANVTVELSNSCLIDVFYKPIEYNYNIDNRTGDVRLRIPRYWHRAFGKNIIENICKGMTDKLLLVFIRMFASDGNAKGFYN